MPLPPDHSSAHRCPALLEGERAAYGVGVEVGSGVFVAVGVRVGVADGAPVGVCVGDAVGIVVGVRVGLDAEPVHVMRTTSSSDVTPCAVATTPIYLRSNAIAPQDNTVVA